MYERNPERFLPDREVTLSDTLKERWNEEVKNLLKRTQETRWEDIRDRTSQGWDIAQRVFKKE